MSRLHFQLMCSMQISHVYNLKLSSIINAKSVFLYVRIQHFYTRIPRYKIDKNMFYS